MKLNTNKRTICLSLAAFALVMGLSVGTVMAYFTAVDTAAGGVDLDLKFTTTVPNEEVENSQKMLTLKNTGVEDCYVRLIALAGEQFQGGLEYIEPAGDGRWTPGPGGYYYYSEILAPGESTTQLNVKFAFPEDPEEGEQDDFNIIIIQESAPVLYDEEGKPYADWDVKADVSHYISE